MIEAEFPENQFEACYDLDFALSCPRTYPFLFVPTKISRNAEKQHGWDSSFLAPMRGASWIGETLVNYFFQYKVGNLYRSSRSPQMKEWGHPYCRFEIPYRRRLPSGQYYLDYTQYQTLQRLSQVRYGVFYVASTTLEMQELVDWTTNRCLVANSLHVPVRAMCGHHRYVSYSSPNAYKLHSEQTEPLPAVPGDGLRDVLRSYRRTRLEEDLVLVQEALQDNEEFSFVLARRLDTVLRDDLVTRWVILNLTLWDVLRIRWHKLPDL